MDTRENLHDSGLRDGRLLAYLLQAGVVVLDGAQRCLLASASACELFDAADESDLRDRWDSIHAALGLSTLAAHGAGDPPLQRRAEFCTATGLRALRYEAHAVADGGHAHHVLLLRERTRIDRADRAILLASEAQAGRHVLTGLVHEAKGPLNNFYLTLSLLSASLARMEANAAPQTTPAQWSRYLDVLRNEAARLAGCLNDLESLTRLGDTTRERVDLCALSRDVLRVLRHEATMRETTIDLDVPSTPVWIEGDAHALRLALLAFASAVLDASHRGLAVGRALAVAAERSRPSLRRGRAHPNGDAGAARESRHRAVPPRLRRRIGPHRGDRGPHHRRSARRRALTRCARWFARRIRDPHAACTQRDCTRRLTRVRDGFPRQRCR